MNDQKTHHSVVSFAAKIVAEVDEFTGPVGNEGDCYRFAGYGIDAHIEVGHTKAMHKIARGEHEGDALALADVNFFGRELEFSGVDFYALCRHLDRRCR